MEPDSEGFLYPIVNISDCINCGLCEKVCQYINPSSENIPKISLAAKHKSDEERKNSTSGGVFPALAHKVISEGGVVYGVSFDENFEAIHRGTDDYDVIIKMKGSKYMQSRLEDSFKEIKGFLTRGIKVLFTGTQCQVGGLLRFLHKDYDNLLAVELICHGASSPATWRDYIATFDVSSVNFRDKRNGWLSSGISINGKLKSFDEDPYMDSFFSKINMRPSCYNCPAKSGQSGADLTIGDFWGINKISPEFTDSLGVSVIIPHTAKGIQAIASLDIETKVFSYEEALKGNPSLKDSVTKPQNRSYFFSQFKKHGFRKAWENTTSMKLYKRIRRKIYFYKYSLLHN